MRVTLTKTSFSSQCCCERRDVAHGYFLTATETTDLFSHFGQEQGQGHLRDGQVVSVFMVRLPFL